MSDCEGYLVKKTGISQGHMRFFDNQDDRYSWFRSKSAVAFNQYSYTKNEYVVSVSLGYDESTEVDYVMYKNSNYSRWYYGRVTRREFVNYLTTRIYFVVDYYSTYSDCLSVGKSFIERTHVKLSEDWDGEIPSYRFLTPEDYVISPTQFYDKKWSDDHKLLGDIFKPNKFVVYSTTDEDYNRDSVKCQYNAGAPVCANVKVLNSLDEVGAYLQKYVSKIAKPFLSNQSLLANIVAVTWVPDVIANNINDFTSEVVQATSKMKRSEYIRKDGKPVKNAKCMTYPYHYYIANSPTGSQMILDPKKHPGEIVNHKYSFFGGLEAACYYFPVQKDMEGERSNTFMRLPSYPSIPISGSVFSGESIWSGIGEGLLGAAIFVGGTFVGRKYESFRNIGTAGLGLAAKGVYDAGKSMFPTPTNFTSSGRASAMGSAILNLYLPDFYNMKLTVDELTSLDDYFDCYGYRLSCFGDVNLKVRKNYTYVKTNDACVFGSCPYEAIEEFKSMLDGGTTFWSTEIGRYDDNPDA